MAKVAYTGKGSKSSIDDVLMQPWFLPKRTADAIRGIVPIGFRSKMRYYFEDYGCMICERETYYHSNGMCIDCYKTVLSRLKKSAKRRARSSSEPRLDLILFRQQRLAKTLLKSLTPAKKTPYQRVGLQVYRPSNPVYEAFSPHRQ
jgi:hypothetical protein